MNIEKDRYFVNWIQGLRAYGRADKTIELYVARFKEFVSFTNKTPTELIREHIKNMRFHDPEARARTKNLLKSWVIKMRENGLSDNSIAQAVAAVKSFYSHNDAPVHFTVPTASHSYGKLPTAYEIFTLVQAIPRVAYSHNVEILQAFILAAKDSGLSTATLLSLSWNAPQATSRTERPYPSIKEQIETGVNPVHVHVVRTKTKVAHDSFFGEESIKYLKKIMDTRNEKIFPISDAYIRHRMAAACRVSQINRISPRTLRKYFITRMKTNMKNAVQAGVVAFAWDAVVEYMAEHKIAKTQRAYFIPEPDELAKIYLRFYDALRVLNSIPATTVQ